ncbi:MAG: hypothetical protein QOK59_06815 [Nitrososphaeraceae archaeon]|nr:hypothetical protein [Nitrososphaeraceae archaeon]MDW0145275.1 hypothetical protein [Nitrososphaeraceae archaeon]MDW0148379.1 hypothetical protein [Nitrososphaeraceae archaeon]MDW0153324.1 hypothetical protein [Nitrososphaeraceae archaeon]MDW0157377.1 hypothetical protein [Nitrososphaeraceae archaeon]
MPFTQKDEIIASFYIFGKDHKVNGELEITNVKDIARKTMEQIARQVRIYANNPISMNQESLRENFNKRSMQILIDSNNKNSNKKINFDITKRISRDPTILSECYAWHLAYYKQDYFFKLFNPLRGTDLPPDLVEQLEGRMLMLGFNVKNSAKLTYDDPIIPFLQWLNEWTK